MHIYLELLHTYIHGINMLYFYIQLLVGTPVVQRRAQNFPLKYLSFQVTFGRSSEIPFLSKYFNKKPWGMSNRDSPYLTLPLLVMKCKLVFNCPLFLLQPTNHHSPTKHLHIALIQVYHLVAANLEEIENINAKVKENFRKPIGGIKMKQNLSSTNSEAHITHNTHTQQHYTNT